MSDVLEGVFDNESTWCRERYVDGTLTAFVSAQLLLQKGVALPPAIARQPPWGTYPGIKPKS